jgi:hypothetical protein
MTGSRALFQPAAEFGSAVKGQRFLIGAILLPLSIALTLSINAQGADAPIETESNVMVELSFTAKRQHEDPFNMVTLDASFTEPNGKTLRAPAFWAGGNKWKVRYASPIDGTHHFRTECSDVNDSGLHAQTGIVEIKPYTGANPFFKHGPIQVAADHRHLQHADGTPFFWLGDTWWMGLCHRLHWPDEVKKLAADRKTKGFNVIQIVAGLYPDMPPFDPRGANEVGFPWEAKYVRIRPEYFDAADKRLEYLVDQGFSPCIVGAWGYFMPWMGVDKAKQHWRYLIARYGALPVVWCAAGEANLPWYLAKGFPYDDRQQVAQWTEVMRYIRETDPYHRPLTIHPTGIGRLSARNATDDPALLDIDMLQTPHGQRSAAGPTVQTVRQSYADKPTMPVIDGEAAYEMLNDSLPSKWTRQMFWLCMTNGAAGHTYGANGIWQCNRRGQPHGKSPHGGDYGHIPWNEAMNLPGSRQLGLGKQLFERFEWQKFVPHAEWAEYAVANDVQPPKRGQWIWFPEGNPAADAPAAKRYFRRTFVIKGDQPPQSGRLWISADDRFTAYLNGDKLAEHAGTGTYLALDITSKLKAGANALTVEAENLPAPVAANPAGLLASLQVRAFDGTDQVIETDSTWRSADGVAENNKWTTFDFDDHNWQHVKELGTFGSAPWGNFSTATSYGPYSTGIADKVRIVYAPDSLPVRLLNLRPTANYQAQAFDPTNGKLSDVRLQSDAASTSIVQKPASIRSEDWVVVVQRTK